MIRPVSPAEYPAALKVIGDAFGLVVRPPTVHTAVAEDPDGHFLVAERDGAIVGTGASVGFGPTGWIGGIAVAPEARGERLGQALTEAVIEALGPRETLLLLASDAGRPIYERLGFEVEDRYAVFWSPPDAAPAPDGLRRLTAADRDAVLALDARVTGETRTLAVDVGLEGALATPDLAAVALQPPWPALPILAARPGGRRGAAARGARSRSPARRARVQPRRRGHVARAGLHAEGPTSCGCAAGRRSTWRPDELWGVFSLFFG